MTKKLLFASLSAMAILPLASCSNEDNPFVEANGDGLTLNVQLPDGIESRQFSTGTLATQLQYAVYESGKSVPLVICPVGDGAYAATGTATFVNKRTTINVKLVDNKDYDIVFWAQSPDAPYHFNAEGQYVETNFNGVPVNDDKYDAFTNHISVNNEGKPLQRDVLLYRPFAQLNIGTGDLAEAAAAALTVQTANVSLPSYTALNLMNTEVGTIVEDKFVAAAVTDENGPATADYTANALPNPTEDEFPVTGYEYLTMNYLLVPADKSTIDVKLIINGAEWKTFNNIPVQRNHRTNLYGDLLTNPAEFNVIIDQDFTKPEYNVDVLWDGSIEAPEKDADGNYVIVDATNLAGLALLATADNNYLENENVVLANDIDFGYNPKYASLARFNGTLDGANHTISGIPAALFATLGGTVKNLNVEGSANTALIASTTNGDVKLENVTTDGSVVGYGVGGMIVTGSTGSLNIKNSTNKANVTDTGYAAGGIVGGKLNVPTEITNTVNEGTIVSNRPSEGKAAGIIGFAAKTINLDNCTNNGKITTNSEKCAYAGGILGWADTGGKVANCTNNGVVTSNGTNVSSITGAGGIAYTSGYNNAPWEFINCVNNGEVKVNSYNFANTNSYDKGIYAGGILAQTEYNTITIDGCTNNANVTVFTEGAEQFQAIGAIAGLLGWVNPCVFTNNTVSASTVLSTNSVTSVTFISAYFKQLGYGAAAFEGILTQSGNTNNTSYTDFIF